MVEQIERAPLLDERRDRLEKDEHAAAPDARAAVHDERLEVPEAQLPHLPEEVHEVRVGARRILRHAVIRPPQVLQLRHAALSRRRRLRRRRVDVDENELAPYVRAGARGLLAHAGDLQTAVLQRLVEQRPVLVALALKKELQFVYKEFNLNIKFKIIYCVSREFKAHSALLERLREHHNERGVLLEAHLPKVGGGVRQRALRRDAPRYDTRVGHLDVHVRRVTVVAVHAALQAHEIRVVCKHTVVN